MDEASFWINDGPRYGWSKKGKPAIVQRSRKRGTKITLALCVRMVPINGSCIVGYSLYDKSMTAAKFLHFLKVIRVGLNNSTENDANQAYETKDQPFYIILDNGSFHGPPGSLVHSHYPTPTVAKVQETADSLQLKLLYMRPLSPEFNPVEYVFSLVKRSVYSKCPKSREDLIDVIQSAIKYISPQSIQNIFKHCIEQSGEEYRRLVDAGHVNMSKILPPLLHPKKFQTFITKNKFFTDKTIRKSGTNLRKKISRVGKMDDDDEEKLIIKRFRDKKHSEALHTCEECYQEFTDWDNKCFHRRAHKVYQCEDCGLVCRNSNSLAKHSKGFPSSCSKYILQHNLLSETASTTSSAATKPSLKQWISSSGVNGKFYGEVEAALKLVEPTINWDTSNAMDIVIRWNEHQRQLFLDKIGVEVVPKISTYLENLFGTINRLRLKLDPPLPPLSTPLPPVCIKSDPFCR